MGTMTPILSHRSGDGPLTPLFATSAMATYSAATIAGYSQPATLMAKEAVQRAEEVSLSEGVRFERRLFGSLFATRDQKEGMAAFVEKRKPSFEDR